MNILIFGRGVISSQYAYFLEKAGHTITFYVKSEKNSVLTLDILDAKKSPWLYHIVNFIEEIESSFVDKPKLLSKLIIDNNTLPEIPPFLISFLRFLPESVKLYSVGYQCPYLQYYPTEFICIDTKYNYTSFRGYSQGACFVIV